MPLLVPAILSSHVATHPVAVWGPPVAHTLNAYAPPAVSLYFAHQPSPLPLSPFTSERGSELLTEMGRRGNFIRGRYGCTDAQMPKHTSGRRLTWIACTLPRKHYCVSRTLLRTEGKNMDEKRKN